MWSDPKRRLLAVWLIVAAAMLAVPLATAHANGRVIRFESHTAGPYRLSVGTIPDNPVVGNLHVTMTITAGDAEQPVLDAEVSVTGVGPESDAVEIGPLRAEHNADDPAFYDINTFVDRQGDWQFTVSVSGPNGEGTARFPIEVRTQSPLIGIVTIMALVAFLAALGFSLRAFLRERSRGRRRS